ncbi:hypothetical protein SDC9_136365 [bioreactor metagenome]|uniref:Uncharacterized protein n=1 Tax=bioreactor metagenome TaxID=1076179 RepID=A0A645DJ18_9ZZZZ
MSWLFSSTRGEASSDLIVTFGAGGCAAVVVASSPIARAAKRCLRFTVRLLVLRIDSILMRPQRRLVCNLYKVVKKLSKRPVRPKISLKKTPETQSPALSYRFTNSLCLRLGLILLFANFTVPARVMLLRPGAGYPALYHRGNSTFYPQRGVNMYHDNHNQRDGGK